MFWSKIILPRKTVLPVLVICIVISVLLITVSGHSDRWIAIQVENKPSTDPTLSLSVTTPQGKKDQRLEIEAVTITAEGFEPQQLERTAGPFILSVTNQSGVDPLHVVMETEQHSRFREKALPLITPYWRERIDPPPGKYIITEENHPEWMLTFIIK
jgi:hypothetical protein